MITMGDLVEFDGEFGRVIDVECALVRIAWFDGETTWECRSELKLAY